MSDMTREVAEIDIGQDIDLADVHAIAVERCRVSIGTAALARMDASATTLTKFVAERRRIYGVTTGYGPLARYDVMPAMGQSLQRNLIMHLATGVGAPLSAAHTRAVMVTRLRTLAVGYSAVSQDVATLLLAFLNANILPIVPEIGTVGASGDLTPLAHIARALIGDGEVMFDGRSMPARQAMASASLSPAMLDGKDGIALVNGTAAMTGIAALNGFDTRRATDLALRLALAYAEILDGRSEAFDPRFGTVRRHAGQHEAHDKLQTLIGARSRLQPVTQPPPFLDQSVTNGVGHRSRAPQDPYSIRCIPQIFGAVFDLLAFHENVVCIELNSVTDNPIVFAEDEAILHGGNFFGQHVANASDVLALAVTNLAVHAERCIARLTDATLSAGLPAFLHRGTAGLNSGLMGAQVTATALVGEMRTLAVPASIQSIPTNANNQDVVTMGTIAARKTARLVDYLWYVLAIDAIAIAQAVEIRDSAGTGGTFSDATRDLVATIRLHVAALKDDRSLSEDIEQLAIRLRKREWTISSYDARGSTRRSPKCP